MAANEWFDCSDTIGVQGAFAVPADEPERGETPRILGAANTDDENGIFVSVDDCEEGNINATEEEVEITVTLDSGAVDHVIATTHLPGTAEISAVTGSRVGKSFVTANGVPMETFGECVL